MFLHPFQCRTTKIRTSKNVLSEISCRTVTEILYAYETSVPGTMKVPGPL